MPGGIWNSLAEFERELVIERTRAGRAFARARAAVQDRRQRSCGSPRRRWANRERRSASPAPNSASVATRSIATWTRSSQPVLGLAERVQNAVARGVLIFTGEN